MSSFRHVLRRRLVVRGVVAPCFALALTADTLRAQETARITVTWTEAPVRDVLRAFAAFSGRSIVVGSGVEGVFVTAEIRDRPWDVALEAILSSHGLLAREDEYGIIRVGGMADLDAREQVEPLVTRTYRVSYARASELQGTIAPLLSERGSASVLERTNALVVTDVTRVQRSVARLIGR